MTGSFTTRHPRLARVLAGTLLALALLLVAVWVAPRASGGAAAWISTPSVRLHALAPGGDGLLAVAASTSIAGRAASRPETLDAGMRFTMAGVTCDVPDGSGVTIRLRTSLDGSGWSPWFEAPLELAGEGTEVTAYTDPVWTGQARYAQVEAVAGGGGPSALTSVRLVAIDPTEDGSVAARLTSTARRLAATVAGVTFDAPALAASSAPVIVTRAQWGADESLRNAAPSYSPVKMAFVHHTASGNLYTPEDGPALMRGIYAYHTESLHWNDIAYNFLVDRYGAVYEGRYGGMTRGVVGAHVYGFNTGSTGISVIGTFTDEAPPAKAVAALERLLAWKLGVHRLSPTGTALLTCGATDKYRKGTTVKFPVIAGHRQANSTECPGSSFYPLLPSMRTAVAWRMGAAAIASLTTSTPLVSPNGDGVLDSVTLNVGVTEGISWGLTLRDAGGDAVASWSGEGTSEKVVWDGTSGGSTVADGAYTADLAAGPADAHTVMETVTITVDTSAPRLSKAASQGWFSPNGDGRAETAALAYTPAEACSVRVGIMDTDGRVIRWLHGWKAREARSYSLKWDGRIRSGSSLVPAADGLYRFDVERRDSAGNTARQGIKITVDRTLGFPSAAPGTFSPDGDGVRDTTALRFKLTRTATVIVRVLDGATVVSTLSLGTLAAGRHSATWDGTAGSGDFVASSRPVFTVTAESTSGESSVSGALTVDLYRPRLYAAGGKIAAAGASTRLTYKVVDPFSAKVDVRYVVRNAKGRVVASGHPGWQPTGKARAIKWRPKARGIYTVTYRTRDLGGNTQVAPAGTVVTVR